MAKKMLIRAAIAEMPALALKAMHAALSEYEIIVVSEAQNLAPVRQAFKNQTRNRSKSLTGTDLDVGMTAPNPGEKITKALIGTGRGRGARRLIRRRGRHGLNKRGYGRDFVIGRVVRSNSAITGETSAFKGKLGATSFQTEIGRAAPRSGRGSRPRYATGYQLGSNYQPLLTPRARYDLARGIGIHKVGARSASTAPAGSIVLGGALRDSIHATDIELTENGLQFYLTASVRYAPYVEYGTYKDYAQPFIRPAIKNSKKKLGPILKKHLRGTGFAVKG